MIRHDNQRPPETLEIKRRKAEDLLAGLLMYRTDLGAEGEELIRLLLNAGVKAPHCNPVPGQTPRRRIFH